jgi:hypothetical protein
LFSAADAGVADLKNIRWIEADTRHFDFDTIRYLETVIVPSDTDTLRWSGVTEVSGLGTADRQRRNGDGTTAATT